MERWCAGDDRNLKVIDSMSIDFPQDYEEALNQIKKFEAPYPADYAPTPDSFLAEKYPLDTRNQPLRLETNERSIKHYISKNDTTHLRIHLLSFYVDRLEGRTRFTLVDHKPAGNLRNQPQNHLWTLFSNDELR